MERAKEIKVLTLRESREKSNIRIMRATKKIKKSKEKDGTFASKKGVGGMVEIYLCNPLKTFLLKILNFFFFRITNCPGGAVPYESQ